MADLKYEDLKHILVQDQVMILKNCISCHETDPAVAIDDLKKSNVEIRTLFFLDWVLKENIQVINSEAVRRYIDESYRATLSRTDTTHILICLRTFFRYTAKNGFFPDITAGVFPDFGDDGQFAKRDKD